MMPVALVFSHSPLLGARGEGDAIMQEIYVGVVCISKSGNNGGEHGRIRSGLVVFRGQIRI